MVHGRMLGALFIAYIYRLRVEAAPLDSPRGPLEHVGNQCGPTINVRWPDQTPLSKTSL